MTRPLRLSFPGAVYHVTSRGNARHDIVADDRDRSQWLSLLAHVVDRYGWLCHAYCLMDNHYHLLLRTHDANLSEAIRWLQVSYSSVFNWAHRLRGHLFQGRFRSLLIEDGKGVVEVARY